MKKAPKLGLELDITEINKLYSYGGEQGKKI
jgi:hypothetical protein